MVESLLGKRKAEAPLAPVYFIKDGLRHVHEYEHTIEINVKGRWCGQSVQQVYATDFQLKESYTAAMIEDAISKSKLLVNNAFPCKLLKLGDKITFKQLKRESPILQ
jgi:hypothetical protein